MYIGRVLLSGKKRILGRPYHKALALALAFESVSMDFVNKWNFWLVYGIPALLNFLPLAFHSGNHLLLTFLYS